MLYNADGFGYNKRKGRWARAAKSMGENLGKRLRALRREKQVTQDELPGTLHVTRQAVSAWERGRSEPDIATLRRMADFYGLTVDEVLAGGGQAPLMRYRRGGLFMLPFVSAGLLVAFFAGALWPAVGSIALFGYVTAAVLIALGNRSGQRSFIKKP